MKLEDLTIKEVCSCLAILNKLQEEGIMNIDLKTTRATINVDKTTEYLENQNVELQQRIKKYEDPEDLTLMFMYCNEKAKDKIKELKERINKAIEYIKERTEYNQYSEVYPSVLDSREVKNILKILKGEDSL